MHGVEIPTIRAIFSWIYYRELKIRRPKVKRLERRVEKFTSGMDQAIKLLESNPKVLGAYLYTSRVRCGRLNCRCMSSEYRHESQCLSFKEDGRSRTRTVPKEFVKELGQLTEAYKELRNARKKLSGLFADLLSGLDKEIDSAARRGRKRLEAISLQKGGRKK